MRTQHEEHEMNIIDSLVELAAVVADEVAAPPPQNQQEADLRSYITFLRARDVALWSLSR